MAAKKWLQEWGAVLALVVSVLGVAGTVAGAAYALGTRDRTIEQHGKDIEASLDREAAIEARIVAIDSKLIVIAEKTKNLEGLVQEVRVDVKELVKRGR